MRGAVGDARRAADAPAVRIGAPVRTDGFVTRPARVPGIRDAVAPLRRAHHAQFHRLPDAGLRDPPAVKTSGEDGVDTAGRQGPHGKDVALGERQAHLRALLVHVGRYPDRELRRAVVRLEVRVGQGPAAAVAEGLGVEVLGQHARGESGPDVAGAAVDPYVPAGVRELAALDEVAVGAVSASVQAGQVGDLGPRGRVRHGVGRPGHLRRRRQEPFHGLAMPLLRVVRAGTCLQYENTAAALAQLAGDEGAGDATTDDDHVVPARPGHRRHPAPWVRTPASSAQLPKPGAEVPGARPPMARHTRAPA